MVTYTNNHCHGCSKHRQRFTEHKNLRACVYRLPNYGNCPCTNCIVKPMCKKHCLDWHSFRDKTFPILVEDFKKELHTHE